MAQYATRAIQLPIPEGYGKATDAGEGRDGAGERTAVASIAELRLRAREYGQAVGDVVHAAHGDTL